MVKDLIRGQRIEENFIIKQIEFKKTKNNKDFVNINLGDRSGEVNGKIWDVTPLEVEEMRNVFKVGIAVKVTANVEDYNEQIQLKIDKDGLKLAVLTEEEIGNLVERAPYSSAKMSSKIKEIISEIKNDNIREITQTYYERYLDKMMVYPAAKSFHHAYNGGLLFHTYTMLRCANQLLEIYKFLNRDLVMAGVIIHDIMKVEEMECNNLGIAESYSVKGQLLGHIIQGVCKIQTIAEELGIEGEESLLLQHMVLSHHYQPEFGSPKFPMFPEAELLHYLDVLDARMNQMEKVFNETKEGEFSGRIYTLDGRNIYHYNNIVNNK